MVTYDFRAVSSVGATLATFGTLDLAKAWAFENRDTFPGLRVEEVTTTINIATVYRPRPRLVAVQQEQAA